MKIIGWKGAVAGTLLIALGNFVVRSVSIVTAPIMTRLLTPEAYGIMALAGSLANFGATASVFGRELGYLRRDDPADPLDRVRFESFLWRGVFSTSVIIGLALAAVWALIVADAIQGAPSIGLFVGLSVVLSAISTMATVRVRLSQGYAKIALAMSAGAIGGVFASIIWALLVSRDAWALAVGGLTTAVLSIVVLGLPRADILFKSLGLDIPSKRNAIALGLSSVFTAPIFWLIMSGDRWALSVFSTTDQVGIYSFASQFGLVGMMLNTAITSTWLTEAKSSFDQNSDAGILSVSRTAHLYFSLLLTLWVAVCAAGGDILRLLSDAPFHSGSEVIPFIATGMLAYGVSWIFVASLFVKSRMRFMTVAWAIGLVVALAAYSLLTPIYGAIGVATGQALAFAAIAVSTWFASERVLPLPVNYPRLVVGAGVSFLFAIALSRPWSDSAITSLLLKAPIGVSGAMIVMALVTPEILKTLRSRFGLR